MGRLLDQKKKINKKKIKTKKLIRMSYRGRDFQRDDITTKIINSSDMILKKSNIEKFIEFSENFGRLLKNKKISSSQIRAIFQAVKRLPDDFEKSKNELNLLRPKLAYQRGRFSALKDLQKVIDHLITNVKDNESLINFKDFFEAIVCYHKAYGGKE